MIKWCNQKATLLIIKHDLQEQVIHCIESPPVAVRSSAGWWTCHTQRCHWWSARGLAGWNPPRWRVSPVCTHHSKTAHLKHGQYLVLVICIWQGFVCAATCRFSWQHSINFPWSKYNVLWQFSRWFAVRFEFSILSPLFYLKDHRHPFIC